MPGTHYEVLGLDPNVTDIEKINEAFRNKKASLNQDFADDKINLAEYRTKAEELGIAQDTLIDPVKKQNYDAELQAAQKAEQPPKKVAEQRTHYQVLGLGPNDTQPYLIRRWFNVRKEGLDNEKKENKINDVAYYARLAELESARDILIDPARKKKYDDDLLLGAALKEFGFPPELIELNIVSLGDISNKLEDKDFLIRKSRSQPNTIAFTFKEGGKITNIGTSYNIENGKVIFDNPQVMDDFKYKLTDDSSDKPSVFSK